MGDQNSHKPNHVASNLSNERPVGDNFKSQQEKEERERAGNEPD